MSERDYDAGKFRLYELASRKDGSKARPSKSDPPEETIGGSGSGPQGFGPGGPGAKSKASGADRETGPITTGQDN